MRLLPSYTTLVSLDRVHETIFLCGERRSTAFAHYEVWSVPRPWRCFWQFLCGALFRDHWWGAWRDVDRGLTGPDESGRYWIRSYRRCRVCGAEHFCCEEAPVPK